MTIRLVKLIAPTDGCAFRDHTGKEYKVAGDRSIDVPEDMARTLLAEGFKRATTAEVVLLQGPKGEIGVTGKQGETGPRGPAGPRGPIGPMPRHQWQGTSLRFEIAPGEWGVAVDLQGPKGESGSNVNTGILGAGDIDLSALAGTVNSYFPSGW